MKLSPGKLPLSGNGKGLNTGILCGVMYLALWFSACDSPVYYYISEDNKPFFENSDTLTFKSNSGKVDTCLIKMSTSFRSSDKKYNYEQLFFSYTLINNKNLAQHSLLSIHQEQSGCSVFNNRYLFINFENVDTHTLSNGQAITGALKGKRNITTAQPGDIIEFIYQPKYGIVSYVYYNNDKFELLLK